MTTIDFQQMLLEERKKAREELKQKKACSIFQDRNYHQLNDLSKYKLSKAPMEAVYYIPDYITEEEEKKCVEAIYKDDTSSSYVGEKKGWVCLSKRRLKNLGGIPHPNGMYKESLPKYITDFRKLLHQKGHSIDKFIEIPSDQVKNHDYNQVLLNEYECGKGIRPHKDGPLYSDIALVLSLKTTSLIDFYTEKPTEENEESVLASVFLEPRSLLIFCKEAYTDYFHGVRDVDQDVINPEKCINMQTANVSAGQIIPRNTTRLSLTIRNVKTVITEKNYTSSESQEIERRRSWWQSAIDN